MLPGIWDVPVGFCRLCVISLGYMRSTANRFADQDVKAWLKHHNKTMWPHDISPLLMQVESTFNRIKKKEDNYTWVTAKAN